jgi:hypothetical protein
MPDRRGPAPLHGAILAPARRDGKRKAAAPKGGGHRLRRLAAGCYMPRIALLKA